ncbi:thioesterase [Balneolaceae bacterium ANBcel3]|nr:thioesterase [Balneolaceae bacterium ANBcel3]
MAYSRTYDIPYFLTDRYRKLRLTPLVQFLEDMAIRHSEHCGVGLDFYEKHNVAWVLAKWDVTIHRYPVFNEVITITTAPTSFRNFFGFRKFDIKDESGVLLAEGASLWIYVDTQKKRPLPVTEHLIDAYGLTPDQNRPLPIAAPEPPENTDLSSDITIRSADIDTNLHVNNARYIEWALDTIPFSAIDGKQVKRLRVDYKKELQLGDEVLSVVDIQHGEHGITTRHRIGNKDKTACFITLDWSTQ